jgi:hypothetical protein
VAMLKRIGWAVGQAATLFLLASLVAAFSVFNSDENSSAFSRDIFYRIFAPLYPSSSDRAATIVLLTDDSFRGFDTFPVRYGTHAAVLRALLSFGPQAVFVDFAFIDNRPDNTIGELTRVLEEYYTRAIPVYLPAHKTTQLANDPGIRPDLDALAKSGRIRLVSSELGRTLWGTPVYAMRSAQGDRLTASAQIAKDLFPYLYNNIKHRTEFEIWWGLPPAPINCERKKDPCPWDKSLPQSLWGSKYSLLNRIWRTIDFQFAPLAEPSKIEGVELPYSPIVTVEELQKGDNRPLIESVLSRKIIYYGADLAIARDNFPNPVFSYRSSDRVLLGVFFHAMALDNIHDLGEHIKIPRQRSPQALWLLDVVSIGVICLCLAVCRGVTGWNSRVLDISIIVVVSIGIALVEFFVLDRAPSNWIGVFSFTIIARLVRSDLIFDVIATRIRSFWRPKATGTVP